MKLKDLIRNLNAKPKQQEEVQFIVWTPDGNIVCADMSGPMLHEMMRVFSKHAPPPEIPPNDKITQPTNDTR